LHRVVADGFDDFLARASESGVGLPAFVRQTFEEFLTCGDPRSGFIHLRCTDCGADRALAFSCKRRGVCTSCAGRRMNVVADHLTSNVFPTVGIRQWVLTLPYSLRYRLAYDRALVGPVLDAFIRSLFAMQRRRARTRYDLARSVKIQCGAITIIQRFGGAINLNVHFHTLVLDGVYAIDGRVDAVEFLPLPPPNHKEVLATLTDTARRIARRLNARRLGNDASADEADPLARDNPLLARLYAAAVEGRVPTGERAGMRTARSGRQVDSRFELGAGPPASARSAVAAGMSLHAGVFVAGTDRRRLARICRYTARPALAVDRLRELPDRRIAYELRTPWNDGTTHILLERQELLARLAAQVPPPRAHQLRYHGILAPAAAYRDRVVPISTATGATAKPPPAVARGWAVLLRHTFAADPLLCQRCGGRMRPTAVVTDPSAIDRLLERIDGGRSP
jgi:hypothetical protein